MAGRDEVTRPAADGPAPESTVRRRVWQPDPRNVKAFDAHLRSRYGDECTWDLWRR